MIYEFKGLRTYVHEEAFVHPQANVTGNVEIYENVYIGPGAVVRGDWGKIVIRAGANVQENCVIHMFPGTTVIIEEGAHLGHGCIVHGASIGKNALIGMNAVIMDDAQIGENSIIGALSFIKAEMVIPSRKVVAGNPAKIIKDVSDEMIIWKTNGTQLYQKLPIECNTHLRETTSLKKPENQVNEEIASYKTWKKTN